MKHFAMAGACALTIFWLSGCGQEPEGPAEKLGKEVDATVQQTQETVGEAVESTAEEIEQAGDELRSSTSGE